MYEDELYPMLVKVGPLNEIRIMLENGESRGFCFAVFKKREDAQVRASIIYQYYMAHHRQRHFFSVQSANGSAADLSIPNDVM